MQKVIDLYYKNPDITPAALQTAGVAGVIHKCVEYYASYDIDPKYVPRKKLYMDAGLLFGAYAFGNNTDGKVQADKFLLMCKPDGTFALALDLEAYMTFAQAEVFVQHIYNMTGSWPLLYTSRGYWDTIGGPAHIGVGSPLRNCPLWFAGSPDTNGNPFLPAGFAQYALWQKGPSAIASLDTDYWQGTLGDLNTFWKTVSGGGVPVVPAPPKMVSVPYISQWDVQANQFKTDCGVTCLAQLLSLYNISYSSVNELSNLTTLPRSDIGLYLEQVEALATQKGLPVYLRSGVTGDDLKAEIDAGRPVVVSVAYGLIPFRWDQADQGDHFMVVTGYDGLSFYTNDPDWPVTLREQGHGFKVAQGDLLRAMANSGHNSQAMFVSPPTVPPAGTPPPTETTLYVNADPDLALRTGPNTTFTVIQRLVRGTKVSVTGDRIQGGSWHWLKVTKVADVAVGQVAYAAQEYLQNTPLAPAPPPMSAARKWGVNIDPRNPAGNPSVKVLGATQWVRFVLKAASMKQSLDQAFAFYDPLVSQYRAAGMNVLVVLNQETYADGIPWWYPTTWDNYATGFAAACGKVAAHYKSLQITYEVWNEPDLNAPNSAYIAPDSYGKVLRAATLALHTADPSCKVLVGGLASGDPFAYLKACGQIPALEGVALHPYGKVVNTIPPGGSTGSLDSYLTPWGPSLALYITEFGTAPGTPAQYATIATYMQEIYDACKSRANVKSVVWYPWSDGMNVQEAGVVDSNAANKESITARYFAIASVDSNTAPSLPPPVPPPAPPPVPVPPSGGSPSGSLKRLAGIGMYDPQYTKQLRSDFIAMCQRLWKAGKPLALVLVMDDIFCANALVPYVGKVLFRWYDYDNRWEPSRMTDLASANAYADELWTGWESIRAQLNPKIVIQPVCERDNAQWSGAFFLRWMQNDDKDGRGYKCGIFGDSPDQPDVSALPPRIAAYRYAMAHGHYYVAHDYGLGKTGPLRYWNTLYNAMPADCRPRVLVGEAGRKDALYIDPPTTVSDVFGYETDLQADLYCDGFAHWEYGTSYQNPGYIANNALPAIEAGRAAR